MSEQEAVGRAPVEVVRAADPGAEARTVAEDLKGDVVRDLQAAEREVRIRVEAGRRALGSGSEHDDDLLRRAESIRLAATARPPISDEDVAELQKLAADLLRAARIRDRTEARFSENLQNRLAASTGVALHPAAIRGAADDVLAAERALEATDAAIAVLGPDPGVDRDAEEPPSTPHWTEGRHHHDPDTDDPVLDRPFDDFDEAALDRRRARTRAGAVFFILVGLGALAFGLGLPVAVPIAAAAAGIVLGALILWRGGRSSGHSHDERARRSRLDDLPSARGIDELEVHEAREAELREAAAAAAAAWVEPPDRDAWVERRAALDGRRDEVEEQLRVARNRWRQLAGPDADPHAADEVVRAHDPQLAYDARVAEASPTVRTVAAFHRRAQARWRVLWAALGRDDPPQPDQLDAILEAELGVTRRARAELRTLEAAEDRMAARATARRPLVLVEPHAWVAAGRLAQLLSSIPPEGRVVLVERDPAATTAS